MLTIFAIPKAFEGHIAIIQRNAITSWLKLKPRPEIILFGDDLGVSEIADELGLGHISSIKKNEFGTPILSSVFNTIETIATNKLLCYINADIILLQNFIETIININIRNYLISGRRYDYDVNSLIDMVNPDWQQKLLRDVMDKATLHGYSGKDYFIYRKGMVDMLDFAVGRPAWDDWLIYHVRSKNIPVIDASNAITVIHQNHDYNHSKFGGKNRVSGPELKLNFRIAGGPQNLMTLRDSDFILINKNVFDQILYEDFYQPLQNFKYGECS